MTTFSGGPPKGFVPGDFKSPVLIAPKMPIFLPGPFFQIAASMLVSNISTPILLTKLHELILFLFCLGSRHCRSRHCRSHENCLMCSGFMFGWSNNSRIRKKLLPSNRVNKSWKRRMATFKYFDSPPKKFKPMGTTKFKVVIPFRKIDIKFSIFFPGESLLNFRAIHQWLKTPQRLNWILEMESWCILTMKSYFYFLKYF